MDFNLFSKQPTRRELLRAGSAMVGGGLVAGLMPNPARAAHVSTAPLQQSGAGGTDRVAQMRAQGVPAESIAAQLRAIAKAVTR